MEIYLKETIEDPNQFWGRKEDKSYFQGWIQGIKKESSPNIALLGHKGTGKTALLQRLYNLTFHQKKGVIPFYYQFSSEKIWMIDFCKEFFLTFFYQFLAYKKRKKDYLNNPFPQNFDETIDTAHKEGFEFLAQMAEQVQILAEGNKQSRLWTTVRDTPNLVGEYYHDYVVEMLDDFPNLEGHIYSDEALSKPMEDLLLGYIRSSDHQNARLLITGNKIGWMKQILRSTLANKFFLKNLPPLSKEETLSMIQTLAQQFRVPIAPSIVELLGQVCGQNPFYISSLFQSLYPDKDMRTKEGLKNILEFETIDERGIIKSFWKKYFISIFSYPINPKILEITLYFSQFRDQTITQGDLINGLEQEIEETELEELMETLIKTDIVLQGTTLYDYQGINDYIFYQVFRGIFQKNSRNWNGNEVAQEYESQIKQIRKQKGLTLADKMDFQKNVYSRFLSMTETHLEMLRVDSLPESQNSAKEQNVPFTQYLSIWSYPDYQEDRSSFNQEMIFALAKEEKRYWEREVDIKDVRDFMRKMENQKEIHNTSNVLGFIFSHSGFTEEAQTLLGEQHIVRSDKQIWKVQKNDGSQQVQSPKKFR